MLRAALRWTWKIAVILRRLVFFLARGSTILLICLMLLFNVATLTLGGLNAAVSSLIASWSGVTTVSARTATRLDRAEVEAGALKAELKQTTSDLNVERRKSDILARKYGTVEIEARRLRVDGPEVNFRGKPRSLRSAVEEVSGAVSRRTARVAATNVGSMAAEGIPFWGIAVIVGATTLEVTAACETMKDMRALEEALGPDTPPEAEVNEVCGLRLPTAEELREAVLFSPGAAWDSAKEFIAGLPTPDFSGTWRELMTRPNWE